MITKQTIVDQIEVGAGGFLQVRCALLGIENDVESRKYHRMTVKPGGDIDAVIAEVNTHLSSMGELPVNVADIVKVKNLATAAWTPEVIAAYKALK